MPGTTDRRAAARAVSAAPVPIAPESAPIASADVPADALPAWLPALMQLGSPALPTGAFSYSQGLETACERGLVRDEASALAWIEAQWRFAFHPRELPALAQAWQAGSAGDAAALAAVNESFLASRDSAEARAETLQMGAALLRWLRTLYPDGEQIALAPEDGTRLCAPAAYALCALSQDLPASATVFGYGFAWLENQVQAAVKLVPLGQSAGQRLQLALRPRLADPPEQRPWSFAPIASIMAMRHERQYTRLFRS